MTTQATDFHFYACSIGTWATTSETRTLTELIRMFEKDKMTYWLWFVPLPHDADYELNFYAPQVEGAKLLEAVEFKNNRRVTTKM